jgi:hypothetical protein
MLTLLAESTAKTPEANERTAKTQAIGRRLRRRVVVSPLGPSTHFVHSMEED